MSLAFANLIFISVYQKLACIAFSPLFVVHYIYIYIYIYSFNLLIPCCFCYEQEDLLYPRSFVQNVIWTSVTRIVEPLLNFWPAKMLRDTALKNIMKHIHYEDESTRYLCICSVNKVMHSGMLI